MLYFPQLETGNVSHYPLTRRHVTRTIVNTAEGGHSIRTADLGASQISWDLTYSGLSTQEWASIEQLFERVQGRFGTFTFIDPTSNLLSWTEDFSKSVWTADPLLQLTPGQQDPVGGTNATRVTNTAQTAQRLVQQIDAPASYQYCFSAYVRSAQTGTAKLLESATGGELLQPCAPGAGWSRVVLHGRLTAQTNGVAFGIELPAGGQVDVFGVQLEAQSGAGTYKKNIDLGGVYPNSRFDLDELTVTTTGPNQHSSQITIISNLIPS